MDKCVRDPAQDCIGSAKALLLEKRIEDLEAWRDDSKQFHASFYDWQRQQIARDARLDEQLSNMEKNIQKLVEKQEEQAAKPGKRWDSIVDKIIWAVLAAVITYLLARFGL